MLEDPPRAIFTPTKTPPQLHVLSSPQSSKQQPHYLHFQLNATTPIPSVPDAPPKWPQTACQTRSFAQPADGKAWPTSATSGLQMLPSPTELLAIAASHLLSVDVCHTVVFVLAFVTLSTTNQGWRSSHYFGLRPTYWYYAPSCYFVVLCSTSSISGTIHQYQSTSASVLAFVTLIFSVGVCHTYHLQCWRLSHLSSFSSHPQRLLH